MMHWKIRPTECTNRQLLMEIKKISREVRKKCSTIQAVAQTGRVYRLMCEERYTGIDYQEINLEPSVRQRIINALFELRTGLAYLKSIEMHPNERTKP